MKKYLVSILFLIICSSSIHAQVRRLSGVIFGDNNEVVNYAAISLLSKDSVVLDGTLTNPDGSYLLKVREGKFFIKIQALGFQPILQDIIISSSDTKKDFHLLTNTVALDEVVVVSKKPLIKREADRLIFDANSVAAGSNSAFDILKNVPGVIVSNDDIKILGQDGVKVLINGKDTKMSSSDLSALLKSYQAEQIDKIEVIVTPPSNFDAEGSAGILNIKLKKAKIDYASATVNYAYRYDKYNNNEANVNLLYNKNRVNASLNIGGNSGKYQYLETNTEEHNNYDRKNLSHSLNDATAYNCRGNIDYQVNNSLLIGALASYNRNKSKIDLDGESAFYSKNITTMDSILLSESPNNTMTDNYRGNLYFDIKIDSLGKTIHIDVDYLHSKYDSKKQFASKSYSDDMQYIGGNFGFNNDNNREVGSLSSSVDCVLPYRSFELNFGAKISLSKTDNIIQYYNQPSLEDQNDKFRFNENIYAIYGGFSKEFTKKLSFESGLRVEHTRTKGTSLFDNNSQPSERTYTGIFPTLYLGYALNPNNQFNFSVSSRISRPSFRNINPFTLYTNKYSIVTGKPDLKPSYTYKLNLGYTLKNNFSIDAFYSFRNNGFTQVQKVDDDGLRLNTFWDNVLDVHSVGINNSYFFNKLSWAQIFFVHGLSYEQSRSNSVYTLAKRDVLMYIAMINASVYFNKQKTFTGWLNTSFNSPQKLTTTDLQSTYNINLGCQYSMLKNKLKISMSLNNIVSSHVKGTVNSTDFKMQFDNKYSYPSLNLALTYTLGARLKAKRYSASEMEKRL